MTEQCAVRPPATLADLRLRAVTPEDTAFLQQVYASTRTEELALTNWTDEQKAAFCLMQFNAQDTYYRAQYGSAEFLVIEYQGTPVGRLYVDRWENQVRVIDISLLPAARGMGIGTKYLTGLQEQARNEGRVLTIHVERMNPALRLYQRLGFQEKEAGEIYLLMEWQP